MVFFDVRIISAERLSRLPHISHDTGVPSPYAKLVGHAEGFQHGDVERVTRSSRVFLSLDLSNPTIRYYSALIIFSLCLIINLWIAKSSFGRVLIAIRENSDRALMLGYNVHLYKLFSVIISGTISGLAGACYGILFGYVGASFAAVPYSIFPLLWVLIGGAGTVLGPLVGAVFMFYLIDYASDITDAYMIIVGITLLMVTLFARRGLLGELRYRYFKWIP